MVYWKLSSSSTPYTDWDRTCVDRVTDDACGTCEMVSDCNGNAVPDKCEPDCNQNSVADECDITTSVSPDCQRNGVPDECESDFDEDGAIDDCDADIDDDGIINENDVCLFTPLGNPINEQGRSIGDLDGDCLVTLGDYRFFAICLSLSGPDGTPGFRDCIEVFDFNADGDVDLRDFAGFAAAVVAKR